MTFVQKAIGWMLRKSIGFSFNTTNIPRSVLDLFGNVGTAQELAVVYGCCRVRGQTIGSVPFHVYRERKSGTRDKFIDHPLYAILHDSPSTHQTSFEFRECMERSFCLWGNAYAKIERLGDRIVALTYLRPDRVRPKFDPQKGLVYEYTTWDGKYEVYRPEEMLHVKNFSDDGIVGQSPLLRYVMEHALAAQSFSSNFLKNSGRLSGYIQHKKPRPVSDAEVEKYKADWQAQYGGSENAGKTAVLWNESAYVPISVPPDEAQLLETAKSLTGDIAGAIYGVPLNLLGKPSETATYASAEQFDIQFTKHTIRPQTVRYEQAFNKALFGKEPNVYCEMNLEALMRGDMLTQAQYFATLHANAGMTSNQWLRSMNFEESKDPNADELMIQMNMIPLRLAGQQPATPTDTQKPTSSSAGGNL